MHGDLLWPALAVATLGNTLGGMSSYLIGRFIGSKKPLTQLERVRRYGAPALLFAWLPIVGDALCVASGWLKLNWIAVATFQAAGRFARYLAVSALT
jgi:membrane protein YqaA with SNARE-associated domain